MDNLLSKDEMQAILREFRQLASPERSEGNTECRQMDFFDSTQPPSSMTEEQDAN